LQASQIQADITHEVVIRYNSSVITTNRILFGTRTFEIASIANDLEEKKYQVLRCKELV